MSGAVGDPRFEPLSLTPQLLTCVAFCNLISNSNSGLRLALVHHQTQRWPKGKPVYLDSVVATKVRYRTREARSGRTSSMATKGQVAQRSTVVGKLARLLDMPLDVWFEAGHHLSFVPLRYSPTWQTTDCLVSRASRPALSLLDIEAVSRGVYEQVAPAPVDSRQAQRS